MARTIMARTIMARRIRDVAIFPIQAYARVRSLNIARMASPSRTIVHRKAKIVVKHRPKRIHLDASTIRGAADEEIFPIQAYAMAQSLNIARTAIPSRTIVRRKAKFVVKHRPKHIHLDASTIRGAEDAEIFPIQAYAMVLS